MKRIGVFGGSFDPVHDAHLAFAGLALAELALDELRWIPAGHPWQKLEPRASAADRAAMVRLAIAGESRFLLDDIEIRRDGPTYTLDTVRLLQAGAPPGAGLVARWFLLIGQDQYARFDTWHGWRELLQRVSLVVAGREGDPPEPPPALREVAHAMRALPLPPMAVSATAIRRRLSEGRPIDDLVAPAVARYIDRHALYRRQVSSRS